MAWNGYFEFAGTEIINVSRTEAYAAGAPGFIAVYENDALGPMLDETFTDPVTDDAPWYDEDRPETGDFYGCYPLDVTGIDDSTSGASVTESVLDGGVVGRIRRATRAVVFNLVLVGKSDCAVEAGLKWLRDALVGGACFGRADEACGGVEMCYLACEPTDPDGDLDYVLRSLRRCTVTTGPSVTAKMAMTCGTNAWTVQFTAIAGNPYEFSAEVPLIHGFMDPDVAIPYFGGVVPAGGAFDIDGDLAEEVECPVHVYVPVTDPDCPLVIAPPEVPSVSLVCFDFPETFLRRSFTIPPASVPLWGEVVPRIRLRSRRETRNLRVRFYADPNGDLDLDDISCNYCGDLVVTYIPQNTSLILDAGDRTVYVEGPNGRKRRADSLISASDGGPYEWPELSCGFGYVVTVDTPDDEEPPILDLSLFSRSG